MKLVILFTIVFATLNFFTERAMAVTSLPHEAVTTEPQAEDVILVGSRNPCDKIASQVRKVVGANRAKCYLRLFELETTCNPWLKQAKGNAGNAHAGYGLCSLEASAAVRRRNRRGRDCNDISTVVNQVKCCRAIMRKTPKYFGPYKRGKISQCG